MSYKGTMEIRMKDVFKIYRWIEEVYLSKKDLGQMLFSFFTLNPQLQNEYDKLLYQSLQVGGKINPLKLYQLIGLLHQKSKEAEPIVNTDKRKHFGIYYTDYSIAQKIAQEALANTQPQDLQNYTFFEPCVGNGIFVIAYIDTVLAQLGAADKKTVQKIINQCFFSDIDSDAIELFFKLLPLYIKNRYGVSIVIPRKNAYTGNILFTITKDRIEKVDPRSLFGVAKGFDIVLTNPPYKLLKANANKYGTVNEGGHRSDVESIVQFIKKEKLYPYNQGTLNYYKLFLEEILENYTHQTSKIGVLIPITLLNDKQSELLRKRILNKYRLRSLHIIPERNDFFPDISQAFCFFVLDKTAPGEVIRIRPRIEGPADFLQQVVEVQVEHLHKVSTSSPVIIENETGWNILRKLNQFPKLGTLDGVCNARGELDLTLDKDFITNERTNLPLLRGNNIAEFSYTPAKYFTDERFLKKLSGKQFYVEQERLVCQQVSNIHLEKRLKFTKIPERMVLGNSCNFISFHSSLFAADGLSLDYLLGILNSQLLNWRFKTTNSNNHISNYELAELPIVLPTAEERADIEEVVRKIRKQNSVQDVWGLNQIVFNLYGINEGEIQYLTTPSVQKTITPTLI